METSKRREIPTMNACVNFSFRSLRKKKISRFFVVFVSTSVTLRNYFRHCQKLHISQQRQRPIQYAHARDLTITAAGRAFGQYRAAPGIIMLHRMHEMRTIVTNVPVAWCVCKSVCLPATCLCSAKTAERIEVLFGLETPGGPTNTVT